VLERGGLSFRARRGPRELTALDPFVHDGDLLTSHGSGATTCVLTRKAELSNSDPRTERAATQVGRAREVGCESGAKVGGLAEIDALAVPKPGVDPGLGRDVSSLRCPATRAYRDASALHHRSGEP
jgi:hypothetical protein